MLLAHYGIRRPLLSLHEHNEEQIAADLVAALGRGESLALISDDGTPLISDPGYALVRTARAAGVPVFALPGPCAAIAALSISGLPTDRFVFAGFLPPKAAARRARLREYLHEPRTVVVYESAHRIGASLADLVAVLGGARRICLALDFASSGEFRLERQGRLRRLRVRCRDRRCLAVAGVLTGSCNGHGLDDLDHNGVVGGRRR